MKLQGQSLIGQTAVTGQDLAFQAINPVTQQSMLPLYGSLQREQIEQACELANAAFDYYRETDLDARATFLETIAAEIEALGDELIERATAESGLPQARLEGERGRTCNQLRTFASVVRGGNWLDIRVDPPLPEREPMPRSDLRQRHIALGPVAVFGASNFPLAFSVAGGDTASALAAGCPVVVKAHPAHPGTSELVGRAIQQAVAQCGLPDGVFSLLFGSGNEIGQALVSHPAIQAVGFTGSRAGGLALISVAQKRPQPIPVYAEMSSINPVLLLPTALESRSKVLATEFVGSLNMGAGQFCTNPGLVLGIRGEQLSSFVDEAAKLILDSAPQVMLTPSIAAAYSQGSAQRASSAQEVARSKEDNNATSGYSALYTTSAAQFRKDNSLQKELFGAAALVVECTDREEMKAVLEHLEGQLTATIQMDDEDVSLARYFMPTLERKAGRLLVNGWPTGVEVCNAMVHGGPFPSTSDTRSTSVGSGAIHRFLRPVCYQDFPEALLPNALKNDNPFKLTRLVDGQYE